MHLVGGEVRWQTAYLLSDRRGILTVCVCVIEREREEERAWQTVQAGDRTDTGVEFPAEANSRPNAPTNPAPGEAWSRITQHRVTHAAAAVIYVTAEQKFARPGSLKLNCTIPLPASSIFAPSSKQRREVDGAAINQDSQSRGGRINVKLEARAPTNASPLVGRADINLDALREESQ